MTAWSPRAAVEAPMVPMVVLEAPNPISVASHPDRMVERQFGDEPRNMLDSNSPRQIERMDKDSHLAVPSSKNTSVSSNLFLHPISEEVEEVFMEVLSLTVNEGCDSQTSLSVLEVVFVDGMQICESELQSLP